MSPQTYYSTGPIQVLWERNRMYPAPTMTLLPELVTRLIPVILQGLPGIESLLFPIHEMYEPTDSLGSVRFCALMLVIRELQEHRAAISAKGSGSISQGSKIKASPAKVYCQLKKKSHYCSSSVKGMLQRTSKKSDGIEKVNKRLISNIYMQAIHH